MATLLTAFAAIAVAQSPLSPLPGDLLNEYAAGDQANPHISTGTGIRLLVWSDTRSNPYGSYEYESSRDIYGVRVDADGHILDSSPIPICTAPGTQDRPQAVWNGENWLVAFDSVVLGGTGYYYDTGLAAVRVAPSGNVLDKDPIKLTGMRRGGGGWSMTSNGLNWLVVNNGSGTSNGIVAMRIGPDGKILDPQNRIVVPESYYIYFNPQVAFADGVNMVMWSDVNLGAGYVLLDADLKPLTPTPRQLQPEGVLALTSNGGQFFATWNGTRPNFSTGYFGRRVLPDGTKLDGEGIDISAGNDPIGNTKPAATWDGFNWRVTWGTLPGVRTARVSPNGVLLDPGGRLVAEAQTGPIGGTGQGDIQIAWVPYVDGNNDVATAVIRTDGAKTPTEKASFATTLQHRPDAAIGANGSMVVYLSSTGRGTRVLAQPLDPNGQATTAEPVSLATGPSLNGLGSPNVAWNGTCYLVAWGASNGIVAQRIDQTGTKLDPQPFLVGLQAFGPADVAALGGIFLVTGRKYGSTPQIITALGWRVNGSGQVLDPSAIQLGGGYLRSAPAVCRFGSEWLVGYSSNWTHNNSNADTAAVFVRSNGTVAFSTKVGNTFSTAGGNGIFEVAVAASEDVAFLFQSAELTSGVETDLKCHRILPSGVVGPQINLTPWTEDQYRPRAAWDGRYFTVVFQDQRNAGAVQSLEQLDARSDLFGMRIRENGTVVDPVGFLISANRVGDTDPNIAALTGQNLLLASTMELDSVRSSYRVSVKQTVTADNEPPVAYAEATPNAGVTPLTVTFNSAGSFDTDGTLTGYSWDFGDGSAFSAQANPVHVYTQGGPFAAKLTVTDDGGGQTTTTVRVWPRLPNQRPVAIGRAVPEAGPVGMNGTFYSDRSFDPDGLIGNVEWLFPGNTLYYGATAYEQFNSRGIWPVDLTTIDSDNERGTTRLHVAVGNAAALAPSSARVLIGQLLGGNLGSLEKSDQDDFVLRDFIRPNPASPWIQVECEFALAQATVDKLFFRIESTSDAVPTSSVGLTLSAFDVVANAWVDLDTRPSLGIDQPYEVLLSSNVSRFVDPATRKALVRLSWRPTGPLARKSFSTATDQLRLVVLYP
ncbi:MAG: PKD domain-containing protein [Fimbriimonadaceae bacterium]|nr:PKD domain-containing protein [Fimbriimonadaceae bacterium]QYK56062.1 MAG: PKD domain-containing protein [Fimbriimonadaceae bacterium]